MERLRGRRVGVENGRVGGEREKCGSGCGEREKWGSECGEREK